MLGTYVTVRAAFVDLGKMNIVLALGIATIKATLVVLYFMHAATVPSAPSWSSSAPSSGWPSCWPLRSPITPRVLTKPSLV